MIRSFHTRVLSLAHVIALCSVALLLLLSLLPAAHAGWVRQADGCCYGRSLSDACAALARWQWGPAASPERCEYHWVRDNYLRIDAWYRNRLRGDYFVGNPECPVGQQWDHALRQCISLVVRTKNFGGGGGCSGGPTSLCGNPIHAGTGNKYQHERDFSPPAGPSFERHYNSQDNRDLTLGKGWRHQWERRLIVEDDEVEAVRADGKTYTFTSADGAWASDSDVTDRLERINGGWRYTTANDHVETYDESGRLKEIADPSGRVTTLSYTDNRLTAVTGPFGRVLTFAYDAKGRLTGMTDPAGQSYLYGYDDQGRLATVTYPDDTTRHYLYERDDFPQLLTGLIDENGVRYASWSYDDNGWAVSSEHAGGVERVELTYNDDGTTTVHEANGATKRYRFEILHGVPKVIEIVTE